MGRRVLITGGAGFIGSHTCLVLLEQGHELVVLDNFHNSSPEALRRVQELAGSSQLTLVEGDVRDSNAVEHAFHAAGVVDGVIHFAGLKAVGGIGCKPTPVLGCECERQPRSCGSDGPPWLPDPGFQQHSHRIRRA